MIKVLIDVNLSPSWEGVLEKEGVEAIHWSKVGKLNASDEVLFRWAAVNDYVVFTNDLDFGTMLAANKTKCPSVIQVRTQDVTPENLSPKVFSILKKFNKELISGALITIDESKARVRVLPL